MESLLKIPCTLIRQRDLSLLLPSAAIAEVFYSEPATREDTPPWLMGYSRWRSQAVRVLDFAAMGQDVPHRLQGRWLVAAIKTQAFIEDIPTIAFYCSEPPELCLANERNLQVDHKPKRLHPLAAAYVVVDGQHALIPDLDAMASLLQKEIPALETP